MSKNTPATPAALRFPPAQRRALLLQPGVGEKVLQRLERAGFASVERLLAHGVFQAMQAAGEMRNRARALQRAVAVLQAEHDPA